MPFRMLCYMVNLWKDFEAGHPKVHHLPVIFPAVLYHGKQKWNSPLNLREMIDGYEKDFEWFIPDFAYRLYDLSQYDDESIVSVGNKALAVVLHLFKHIFDEIFGDVFRGTADRVIEIDDQKMFSEILEWAVTYFLHARNEDADELIDRETEGVDAEVSGAEQPRNHQTQRKVGDVGGRLTAHHIERATREATAEIQRGTPARYTTPSPSIR